MATCRICASPATAQGRINAALLNGAPLAKVSRACGLPIATVKNHRLNHIPYMHELEQRRKRTTVAEKFELLEFQLARLRVLAEAGESVLGALRVAYAQKSLLELQMRGAGELDPTNKKKMLAAPSADQDFEVVFSGGRART